MAHVSKTKAFLLLLKIVAWLEFKLVQVRIISLTKFREILR